MKKRVAIYYSNKFGRNDGSPLYYFNVLQHMPEFETLHLLPEGDTRRYGKFDYHFWVDWGEDGLPWTEWSIPSDGGKTIYVASDTHLGKDYRFKKAEQFDHVFFNQKDAVEEFNKTSRKKAIWIPHAVEPQAYPDIEIVKKFDICFIGHVQESPNYNGIARIDALDRMFKEFPNFYYGSRHPAFPGKNLFEDAAKKFSQSKIVFNISIKDDINMRVFESLATGSMLLTNYIPTLGELFEDGKHLVMYKTLDEAVEKAKYYLEHEQEREKIALEGQQECLAKHTYQKRVEKIIDLVNV
jgi:glycosyltransferase involved in cell wall biosynthesis